MSASDERPRDQESPDEDLWGDLLDGVTFEEADPGPERSDGVLGKLFQQTPADEARPTRGRGKRASGFSPLQKAVLGILFVLVALVWVGLIVVVLQSTRAAQPAVPATPFPVGQPAATAILSPTATPMAAEAFSPATTMEPSPTPQPAVASRFDEEIRLNPDNVSLRVARGQELIGLRAYSFALLDFEHAMTLNPTHIDALLGAAACHFALQQWSTAEVLLDQALALDPENARAHFDLGILYYYRGDFAAAMDAFDRAAEFDRESAQAEAWLAIAAAHYGDAEEAWGAAERALAISTDLPVAYVARAWARLVQDPPDTEGAHGDLLHARRLAPYAFVTLNALAEFYVEHQPERIMEAEQLALYAQDWARLTIERASALHTLGRVYLALDRRADALQVLGQAAQLATSDGEVVLWMLTEDLERAGHP